MADHPRLPPAYAADRQPFHGVPGTLQRIDARRAAPRRFRKLVAGFMADLGVDELSATDRALVETAATVKLKIEKLTSEMVAGLPIDGDQVVRLGSTLKRLLEAISAKAGERQASGQDPLEAHIAAKYSSGAAEATE